MNWKDTLRKAPFRVSDEQGEARKEKALKKKKLLQELQISLEKYIDEPFRKLIRQDPSARAYTLELRNNPFFADLQKFLNLGLENLDIEKLLAEEYDVEDIMIDYGEKTITFEK